MSKGTREAVADWLMVIASLVLVGSLFLTWSHQVSAPFQSAYGATPALRGIPLDPNAWQVYSAADVVLAILAASLVACALRGGRRARLVLAGCIAVALAFVVHALAAPPTTGTNLLGANLLQPTLKASAYSPNAPTAGAGETLAVIALALGLGGLGLSFTAD